MFARLSLAILLWTFAWSNIARAQLQDRAATDAVRVTVTINPDGSRTSYEFDPPNRKAVATTTTKAGKQQGQIRYELDEAGRFAAGEVFAGDGKFRFKTRYQIRCRRAFARGNPTHETRRAGAQDRLFVRLGGEADRLRGL